MERRIIPLYMPPHSSHLLQLLDVSCFASLKHLYGQRVQEKIQKGIYSIGKEDFIHIYPAVHQQALSSSNIQSGFEATGLVPLSSERVLSKIQKTLSRRCRWPFGLFAWLPVLDVFFSLSELSEKGYKGHTAFISSSSSFSFLMLDFLVDSYIVVWILVRLLLSEPRDSIRGSI